MVVGGGGPHPRGLWPRPPPATGHARGGREPLQGPAARDAQAPGVRLGPGGRIVDRMGALSFSHPPPSPSSPLPSTPQAGPTRPAPCGPRPAHPGVDHGRRGPGPGLHGGRPQSLLGLPRRRGALGGRCERQAQGRDEPPGVSETQTTPVLPQTRPGGRLGAARHRRDPLPGRQLPVWRGDGRAVVLCAGGGRVPGLPDPGRRPRAARPPRGGGAQRRFLGLGRPGGAHGRRLAAPREGGRAGRSRHFPGPGPGRPAVQAGGRDVGQPPPGC